MLIIYRGQRSVLYSPESSPADSSSLGYSVTNDIFRWHSLSCKHLWGWWSQEKKLRKAKNRLRAATRHEEQLFPLWEREINSLYRSIIPYCAMGLGLCKGEGWNLHPSMDCQAPHINEANGPLKVTVGTSFLWYQIHQDNSQLFQNCPLSYPKAPELRRNGFILSWILSMTSLSFGTSQGMLIQACDRTCKCGKCMTGGTSDMMTALLLVWWGRDGGCGKPHTRGAVMGSLSFPRSVAKRALKGKCLPTKALLRNATFEAKS